MKTRLKKPSYIFLLLLVFSSCESTEEKYDRENNQTEILSRDDIDNVLASFDDITYEELNDEYKTFSECEPNFGSSYKNKIFQIIKGDDIYKFIVGKYRVKDFLAADNYYHQNLDHLEDGKEQFWLVDKKMLYMMLDLILNLEKIGYNKYGFNVRESHRHPMLNRMRGGASKSQHIWGTAVDITIKDIDKDGDSDVDDKDIVLKIMEKIVGDSGGLGRYPGTQTVHFDSRGYRARWDAM